MFQLMSEVPTLFETLGDLFFTLSFLPLPLEVLLYFFFLGWLPDHAPEVLLEAPVYLLHNDECNNLNALRGDITDEMICATEDLDNGGPYACHVRKMNYFDN